MSPLERVSTQGRLHRPRLGLRWELKPADPRAHCQRRAPVMGRIIDGEQLCWCHTCPGQSQALFQVRFRPLSSPPLPDLGRALQPPGVIRALVPRPH